SARIARLRLAAGYATKTIGTAGARRSSLRRRRRGLRARRIDEAVPRGPRPIRRLAGLEALEPGALAGGEFLVLHLRGLEQRLALVIDRLLGATARGHGHGQRLGVLAARQLLVERLGRGQRLLALDLVGGGAARGRAHED